MARVYIKLLILLSFVISSVGCSSSTIDITDSLQSTNAKILKKDFSDLCELLIEFKGKLDARNPKNFDENNNDRIIKNIQNRGNNFSLSTQYNSSLELYHQYLNLAFDVNNTKWYRNDLLIVGIYKMLYDAYEVGVGHKLTALSYNKNKMSQAYKYLQVIRWRINTLKDKNNNPLFVTWQNNWQLELLRKFSQNKVVTFEDMANLYSIKNKKESFLDPSNMSFDNILNQMIYILGRDLKTIGLEPTSLGIEGIKSIVLFL